MIARKMLNRAADAEITGAERQLGKAAELASGFGGSVGAWRRIVPHDCPHRRRDQGDHPPMARRPSSDPQVLERSFAQPAHRHPHRRAGSGRSRAAAADRRDVRGRDLAAEAAERARDRLSARRDSFPASLKKRRPTSSSSTTLAPSGSPIAAGSACSSRTSSLASPGICSPPRSRVSKSAASRSCSTVTTRSRSRRRSAHCRTRSSATSCSMRRPGRLACRSAARCIRARIICRRRSAPAEPLAQPDPDERVLEAAIDVYIDDTRDDIGPIDDPALVEREDDEDFIAGLPDDVAPLPDLVSLPLTADNKVCCPFHDEIEPSCAIYPDHFHCFGCGEHGGRLDWLTRAEGMTKAEAIVAIKDWSGPCRRTPRESGRRREAGLRQSDLDGRGTAHRLARRALSRRDARRRPHQAAAGYPPVLTLPSGVRVRLRRLCLVPDRADARPADRCAGRNPEDSARGTRTDGSRRSSGACSARPAS